MIRLDAKRKKFDIVVSDLGRCKCEFTTSISRLSKLGCTYFAIVHDKDKNTLRHLHLVLVFDKRKTVNHIINLLTDIFDCNDVNIQVQECLSLSASVQYLVHKNNPDKYQYGTSEIITNDMNQFDDLYSVDTQRVNELDYSILYNFIVVKQYKPLQVMSLIGINNYNHYYKVIQDMYKYS